jgi:predicted aspartyl protease
MQRLRSVIIGYVIVTLFCVSQPIPESKAANQVFSESVIARANSVTLVYPLTEGIRLAKSDKKEDARGENDTWRYAGSTVISTGDETTKVKIIGNSVLVPVTLVYGGNEVDTYLLLDTGATRTAIHTEIAEQLSINLNQARETKVQVVGGEVLHAHVARISSLTFGPHTKSNWNIFVIPHKGSAAKCDGLLGMDVLRGLKYKVDFEKQVIVWE